MSIDGQKLNELTSRATDLMSQTADIPRVLGNHLGSHHPLVQAAGEMQVSIENLVRELRRFDVSDRARAADSYGAS